MAKYRLSRQAEDEIDHILEWSEENFGELASERYAALLIQAMEDVAERRRQNVVLWKPTAFGEVGIYHIRNSRNHVPNPPGPVRDPRHFLIFRIGRDGVPDILGFIHDSMLFERALRRLTNPSRYSQ
jgi:toxin ParE1/3/4